MVSAIILAGGKGKRMGAEISKQYIEINEKPILYYTLSKFINSKSIDKIILVLPKDEIEYCKKNVLEKFSLKVDKIVEGGKERQDSVFNALSEINESEIVLIHDGARPFTKDIIIEDGIKYARLYGAAAPGVTPKDTIKVIDDNGFSKFTPDRSSLVAIQTPQVFKREIIKECHKKVREESILVTDDTMVVERYNNKVYLYEGDYENIKVTTSEDLILAEKLV
jgi:2-C-methyl-D-erythritol 4-phosphate cytidylyltransferase